MKYGKILHIWTYEYRVDFKLNRIINGFVYILANGWNEKMPECLGLSLRFFSSFLSFFTSPPQVGTPQKGASSFLTIL